MDYAVLSPVGELDAVAPRGLMPRVPDLNGKTIGLFPYFKWYGPAQMQVVEEVLKERFPTAKFTYFQQYPQVGKIQQVPYPELCTEVLEDEKRKEEFKKWVNSVDIVVSGHGD